MKHIVKENKTLQRDMHSKAIINTDNNAQKILPKYKISTIMLIPGRV